MLTTQRLTQRLSALADSVVWQLRGMIETDAVRPFKFGFRDMWQRDEIEARKQLADELVVASHPVALSHETGYLANPFAGRIDLDPVCRLGKSLAQEIEASHPRTLARKDFHINKLLPADPAAVDVMLSVALHEELIATATAYLGIVPILGDLDLFCSLPTPLDQPYSSSQLYHCDDTSLTQLKFFVYCDGVTELDGPLEVVDATWSKQVRDRVRYRYGGRASRVADDAMSAIVDTGKQHAFVGPRGTSFLVDTARCFHRGSRIRDGEHRRMVAVFQFVPPHCTQLPLRLRSGAPYRHLVRPTMSPLVRAVLGEPVAR